MSDAARTFGRRGLVQAPPRIAVKPRDVARGADAPVFGNPMTRERASPGQPVLTYGLIGLLVAIYFLERRFAFEIDQAGAPSLMSIEALGGASYNFIVGQGQWWRMFLAPLLHSTFSHLIGNCVSLLLIGVVLEKAVGRAWTAGLFVIGALGGMAGSLLGNAHSVMTVGASGAILGLVSALFVLSFLPRADPERQAAMRKMSVRIGLLAIMPLAFGSIRSSAPIDNFAHLGGALAGAAAASFICLTWPAHRLSARFGGLAAILAIAGLGASAVASRAAIVQFPIYAERATHFMPAAETPANFEVSETKAADLVARYPIDPRAHLMRGLALARLGDLYAGQLEFQRAWTLASSPPERSDVANLARSLLAVTVAMQGQRDAAKALAADICKGASENENQRILRRVKLCD